MGEYQSDVMTSRRRRETKNRGPVLVRLLPEKGDISRQLVMREKGGQRDHVSGLSIGQTSD